MQYFKPTIWLVLFFCTLLAPSATVFGTTSFTFKEHPKNPVPDLSQQKKFQVELMKRYVQLSVADYEKLKGKKLGFFDKAYFRLNQHRMKKLIRHYDDEGTGVLSKISWFLKGFLLGPIAVLLAYILFKDEERELIKWAWFGFATWPVLLAVYFIFYAGK